MRFRLGHMVALGCVLLFLTCASFVLWVSSHVNEPEPSQVNLKHIAAILQRHHLPIEIKSVRYVNLDFGAYIVEGELTTVPKADVRECDGVAYQIDGRRFFELTGAYGMLRWIRQKDHHTIIGVVLSSEEAEEKQGLPRFLLKWRSITNDVKETACDDFVHV